MALFGSIKSQPERKINRPLVNSILTRISGIDRELLEIRAVKNRITAGTALRNKYDVMSNVALHHIEYLKLLPKITSLYTRIVELLSLIDKNKSILDIREETLRKLRNAKIELSQDLVSLNERRAA